LREWQVVDTLAASPCDDAGDGVRAEPQVSPSLDALDASAEARIIELEAQIADERAARVEAETTAREIAALVAQQHQRTRVLEEDLRAARAQVPMFDQQQIRAAHKRRAGTRVRRALGR
jgi:uncharacterized coiled-coil protein SlyX